MVPKKSRCKIESRRVRLPRGVTRGNQTRDLVHLQDLGLGTMFQWGILWQQIGAIYWKS